MSNVDFHKLPPAPVTELGALRESRTLRWFFGVVLLAVAAGVWILPHAPLSAGLLLSKTSLTVGIAFLGFRSFGAVQEG